MNNVRCSGAEKRVEDCAFDGWHEKRCTAQESAGAVCGTYCYRSVATHKIVVPHNVTPPAGAAKVLVQYVSLFPRSSYTRCIVL